MFRGEIALLLPVDWFFADSQSPLITLPHFYLPVMAARGETRSVQDTMPAEISGDLPSGFGTSSHTGHSLGPQRGQERGWWWLRPEWCPLRTSGTRYSYADLLPAGNRVGPWEESVVWYSMPPKEDSQWQLGIQGRSISDPSVLPSKFACNESRKCGHRRQQWGWDKSPDRLDRLLPLANGGTWSLRLTLQENWAKMALY